MVCRGDGCDLTAGVTAGEGASQQVVGCALALCPALSRVSFSPTGTRAPREELFLFGELEVAPTEWPVDCGGPGVTPISQSPGDQNSPPHATSNSCLGVKWPLQIPCRNDHWCSGGEARPS